MFNLIGYSWTVTYMIEKQHLHKEALVDKEQYAEHELISFKSAIQLPYYANSETFEKVHGAVEVDGVVYRYVKRRIFNDSLELLCLPDASKQKLLHAQHEFFKLSVDHPVNNKNKTTVTKLSLPDWYHSNNHFEPEQFDCEQAFTTHSYISAIRDGHSMTSEQPPELLS